MATSFSRSMRSLAAAVLQLDGGYSHRCRFAPLLGGVVLFAQVPLSEVTTAALLEVARAIYPLEAPVAGRVSQPTWHSAVRSAAMYLSNWKVTCSSSSLRRNGRG